MTLEIHNPALVARVNASFETGRFQNADDLIEKALDALAATETTAAGQPKSHGQRSGADLIAALQASPYRELNIEPPRVHDAMPVRDVTF
jgi:hypothetical protein